MDASKTKAEVESPIRVQAAPNQPEALKTSWWSWVLCLLCLCFGSGGSVASGQSLPDKLQLEELGKNLTAQNGSSVYHTYVSTRGAIVAVETSGAVDDDFPYVIVYGYDPLLGGGSNHRGLAHRLYFEEKESRTSTLANAIEIAADGIRRKSSQAITDLTPQVSGALFNEMIGHVHDIVGGLGAKTAGKKLIWLFSEGAKSLELYSGQSGAEVTYEDIVNGIEDAHFKVSCRAREMDEVLLRIKGPVSWTKKAMTGADLLSTAQAYDDAWDAFRMSSLARDIELEQLGDVDALAQHRKFYNAARLHFTVEGIAKVGPSLAKMAFSDEKCEKMRTLLVQAFYHAYAAKGIVDESIAKIGDFRRHPTPELAHDLTMALCHASINIELALRIQAAVVETNRDGDLGGQILAWIYEHVLAEPGAIDRNIKALRDLADEFNTGRLQLTDREVPYMGKLCISVREVRPLPWTPSVGQIIATAEPLVVPPGIWQTRIHGVVLTKDALPAKDIDVKIEDPIHDKLSTVRTTEGGVFSLSLDTRAAEAGLFTFVCSTQGVEPATVVVACPPRPTVISRAGDIPAPIGPWADRNSISRAGALFALTHRSRSTVLERASLPDMLSAAEAVGRAQAAYWARSDSKFAGASDDAVRLYALGTPGDFDVAKAGQSAPTEVLYGIHTGKREALISFARRALAVSPQGKPNLEELDSLVSNPSALVVAFVLDPYSGICGWPEDVDRASPMSSNLVVLSTKEGQKSGIVTIQFSDMPRVAEVCIVHRNQLPTDQGLLDVVLLIDKSGSMEDDIEVVKEEVDSLLGEMSGLAKQQNISLQMALVTFAYMGKGQNQFEVSKLSPETEPLRQFVAKLNTQAVGGDEDLYSALMYAMNEPVEGKQIDMGWREGAAKITIPITDEMPKEDNFTLSQVAKVAEELDPVHMYPLLTPKGSLGWLDPADRSLGQLAEATGGQTVRVRDAKALPQAIVDAVKLAIRRHKEEIWRKSNPPYLLYGTLAGLGFLAMVAIAVGVVAQRRSLARRSFLAAASRSSIDPTLTGESYVRPPNEPPHPTRGENP